MRKTIRTALSQSILRWWLSAGFWKNPSIQVHPRTNIFHDTSRTGDAAGQWYRNFRRYLDQAGISHTGHGPWSKDPADLLCKPSPQVGGWWKRPHGIYTVYENHALGHEGFEETAYYLKLTTEMYPSIRNGLQSSFPNLIQEVPYEEREFYWFCTALLPDSHGLPAIAEMLFKIRSLVIGTHWSFSCVLSVKKKRFA